MNKTAIKRLKKIVGKDGFLNSTAGLISYSYDATTDWQSIPELVLFPESKEQVSEIMKIAYEYEIPVTVRGAGTNISGGSIPVSKGIVLCTTRMNKILELSKENMYVHVEAGVVLNELYMFLKKHGLFFPPDPQSFLAATVGGCISENSGGPYAVKYGVFKHYLLGITVVLPDGEILHLGGKTLKNVAGYDLCQLICGSEGTLAIITDAILKVIPLPEASKTIVAAFRSVESAAQTVSDVISERVLPAKIELMDNWIIRRIEEINPIGLPMESDALLLFEVDGTVESVQKEAKKIADICKRNRDIMQVIISKDEKEAEKIWNARRSGFSAIFSYAPTILAEDVAVPPKRLPELISRIKEIEKKYGLTIVLIGHAGDGNLHPSILTDVSNKDHYKKAQRAVSEIFKAALELEGSISGEHGIGLEKKEFLKKSLPYRNLELLKEIKKVFDPKGILNPGKIW